MSLYLYQNDQQTGPFTEEQIRAMIQAGAVSTDAMGWKEGMADWQRMDSLVSAPNVAVPPPAPKPRSSPLGMISLVFSLISIVGWGILLIVAGVMHNNGTATQTSNMIVGFFFVGGVLLNFVALLLGLVGMFKSRANTLAIIGTCLNAFILFGLVLLMLIGLAASKGAA